MTKIHIEGTVGCRETVRECEPFGSLAKAEFENNDRHCDMVERLQRKETSAKRIWERSPAGIEDHIVGNLI